MSGFGPVVQLWPARPRQLTACSFPSSWQIDAERKKAALSFPMWSAHVPERTYGSYQWSNMTKAKTQTTAELTKSLPLGWVNKPGLALPLSLHFVVREKRDIFLLESNCHVLCFLHLSPFLKFSQAVPINSLFLQWQNLVLTSLGDKWGFRAMYGESHGTQDKNRSNNQGLQTSWNGASTTTQGMPPASHLLLPLGWLSSSSSLTRTLKLVNAPSESSWESCLSVSLTQKQQTHDSSVF